MENQNQNFVLLHDNLFIYQGAEFDCCLKLQKSQSQSYDWATKYEGWTVAPESEFPVSLIIDYRTGYKLGDRRMSREYRFKTKEEADVFIDKMIQKDDSYTKVIGYHWL